MCYSCGYEKVFWVPVAPGRSTSFSNDLTHVYTRLFRNEGVMPTPLLTAPEYQQGIVYRPYRCPYDTVVMYGYIGPHVASDLQLQHACLALRDTMVLDPVRIARRLWGEGPFGRHEAKPWFLHQKNQGFLITLVFSPRKPRLREAVSWASTNRPIGSPTDGE